MDIQIILVLIAFAFALLGVTAIPWLKKKGLWTVALFGVNIAEQICDFMDMQGYGEQKYAFVRKLILMFNKNLREDEIETIIETLVSELNNLKGR